MSALYSYLKSSSGVKLGAISVVTQVLVGGEFVTVGNNGLVQPGKTLRVLVDGIDSLVISVEIIVYSPPHPSNIVFITANPTRQPFSQRAWYDFQGPFLEGAYSVKVRSQAFGTSYAETWFQVDQNAIDPTPAPEGGIGGFLDKLKWPLLIVLGIVVVSQLGKFKR